MAGKLLSTSLKTFAFRKEINLFSPTLTLERPFWTFQALKEKSKLMLQQLGRFMCRWGDWDLVSKREYMNTLLVCRIVFRLRSQKTNRPKKETLCVQYSSAGLQSTLVLLWTLTHFTLELLFWPIRKIR